MVRSVSPPPSSVLYVRAVVLAAGIATISLLGAVMVVRGRSSARTLALGLAAVARGIGTVTRTPEFESFIVDKLRIDMKGMGTVAVDGEIAHLTAPLRFELRRDALAVVCPPLTAVTDAPG